MEEWGFSVIIVFGSLNIDMMMPVGHLPHPGETVMCSTDYLSNTGGKGANQAVAAARAGAKVAMVGMVGDDNFGRRSVSNLKTQGVMASGVAISERPTGCATIAVDSDGENIVISAPGANLDARADQVPDELLIPRNLILTQMEMTPQETFTMLKRAHARGVTTILNAAPVHPLGEDAIGNIDYLIMNEIEAHQLAYHLRQSASEITQIALNVAKLVGCCCIVTMEGKGSVAARGADLYVASALKVEVVDSTGAGDAFCGIFAACLQNGMDWIKAWHRASVGASLSCLGLGAQDGAPFMDDIEKRLKEVPAPQKL